MRFLIIVWAAVFQAQLLYATQDRPECEEVQQDLADLDESIRYLEEIRKANLDFISELGEGHESQVLKARSNIRIAEKRVLEARQRKQKLESVLSVQKC